MDFILSCLWPVVVAWLIVRAVRQSRCLRQLAPARWPDGERAPSVAVVVPARDESANIGRCLDGLRAQDYPPGALGVVVVDDHSADDTAAIAAAHARADPRVHLVRSPALPPRWIGKSHACWIGAGTAPVAAEWLCFVDADVRLEPAALATALQAAERDRVDLLSLAPRQELVSFAERLMIPCGLYALGFCQDLERLQSREGDGATATGQFMLVRRAAYEAVGGHAAISAAVSEDVALARLLKRSGRSVVLHGGERLLSSRMYTGWRTLWPGFAKNLVDMLGGPASTVALALLAVLLAWLAVVLPLAEAIRWAEGSRLAALGLALALPGSLAMLALHVAGTARFRIPVWYGLLFPVGYTAGALMALDSVRRRLAGRVSWKGRLYP